MMPVANPPIRLGGQHCCVCATICHHIGPMQLCDQHGQPAALADPLATIRRTRLGEIPATAAAKVVRRIVDGEELAPRLEVAAFNSAP